MKFKTTLLSNGKTATGIEIPDAVAQKLGGKRVPVAITINNHTWRTTTAMMGGKLLVGVSKEHRELARVAAGDAIIVTIEVDTAPREVEVPDDFAKALAKEKLRKTFDSLAYSHRKEHVRAIEEAKAPETRQRRIDKAVEMVRAKK